MFSTVLALAIVAGWGGGSPMQFASPGCPGGICPAPRRTFSSAGGRGVLVYDGPATTQYRQEPQREYRWSNIEHDGLIFQVWGYLEPSGKFRWYQSLKENQESWARAKEAALALKPATKEETKAAKVEPDINLTGIDPSKFHIRPDMYTARSHEARMFVEDIAASASDKNKIHVTVIGPEDDCKKVMDDLNLPGGAFSAIRGCLLVNEYRPKEWQVDPGLGFPISGRPSIIVQTAKGPLDPVGGKVIYRANDYSRGPSEIIEAIRKANPNYKPLDDPGPATGKTDDGPMAFLIANPIFLVSAVALVLLLLISPKRKDG